MANHDGCERAGATWLDRRLSWAGHAAHDGGGAAFSQSRRPPAGKSGLGISRAVPDACGLDRLQSARSDPAVVFVSGRDAAAVFARRARRGRAVVPPPDAPRALAVAGLDRTRDLSPLHRQATNEFHV